MIGVLLVNNFLIWLKVAMSEKVLLVCSSNSTNFRKAVNCLSTQSIFDKPELDFLCSLGDLQDLRHIQEAKKSADFIIDNSITFILGIISFIGFDIIGIESNFIGIFFHSFLQYLEFHS